MRVDWTASLPVGVPALSFVVVARPCEGVELAMAVRPYCGSEQGESPPRKESGGRSRGR